MLVLTRKKNEGTHLYNADGTRCDVVIVSVQGNKVRLGFRAPSTVSIVRSEIDEPAYESLPEGWEEGHAA